MRSLSFALLLALCGCGSNSATDAGLPDAGPDLSVAECNGSCTPGSNCICNVDFPCSYGNTSYICDGNTVVQCNSHYYNGPSPECDAICGKGRCCSGGSCNAGTRQDCPAGTQCMEHEKGYRGDGGRQVECQPLDGGLDLGGWQVQAHGFCDTHG